MAIETKYPFTYKGSEKFLELTSKYPTVTWFWVRIRFHEDPPYYTLITEFGNNQEAENTFFRNVNKLPRVEKPRLRRNEIWIEHQLWRALRKEKLFVAPQLKLSKMEIDLLVEVPRRKTIATEIKDLNGSISNIQINNYKSLPFMSIFIVPKHLKKKINSNKIKVLSYRYYEDLTQDYFIRSLLSFLE
jgi:hypothetical protein